MSLKAIVFSVLAAQTVSAAAITRRSDWFTFYNDDACTDQSGGVSYDTSNLGCFSNGGAYGAYNGQDDNHWIKQFDSNDCTGDPTHFMNLHRFFEGRPGCLHLDDFGLHTGFGSYQLYIQ